MRSVEFFDNVGDAQAIVVQAILVAADTSACDCPGKEGGRWDVHSVINFSVTFYSKWF